MGGQFTFTWWRSMEKTMNKNYYVTIFLVLRRIYMKPDFFSITMYPTVSFNEEEVLGRLLDVFESNENLLLLIGVTVKWYE